MASHDMASSFWQALLCGVAGERPTVRYETIDVDSACPEVGRCRLALSNPR